MPSVRGTGCCVDRPRPDCVLGLVALLLAPCVRVAVVELHGDEGEHVDGSHDAKEVLRVEVDCPGDEGVDGLGSGLGLE